MELLAAVRNVFASAPLYTPRMPKSGRPFTVRMSNCGAAWMGVRREPDTDIKRPIPKREALGRRCRAALLRTWNELGGYPEPPEACLINFYGPAAKMGLHQDRDEADFAAPVISISLGDSCLFRVGGQKRGEPTRAFRLSSGDALVLGGASRLAFHGVDRIYPGTSRLLPEGGRINLTLRRVTRSAPESSSFHSSNRGSACSAIAPPAPIRASGIAAATALIVSSAVFWTILATAATAADAVFPPGSRVGLVPPPGMVPSNAFDGFADPEKDAAILITVLPAAAYSQFEKTMDTDVLKKQGVSLEKREPIKLDTGKGFLLSGRQVADKTRYRKWLLVAAADDLTALVTVQVPEQETLYSDRIVRAALATLSVRAKVPEAEELSLLPFAVADLAGFHVDGVLRGRVLMLERLAQGKSRGCRQGSAAELVVPTRVC